MELLFLLLIDWPVVCVLGTPGWGIFRDEEIWTATRIEPSYWIYSLFRWKINSMILILVGPWGRCRILSWRNTTRQKKGFLETESVTFVQSFSEFFSSVYSMLQTFSDRDLKEKPWRPLSSDKPQPTSSETCNTAISNITSRSLSWPVAFALL
jgi:hypothetical protein